MIDRMINKYFLFLVITKNIPRITKEITSNIMTKRKKIIGAAPLQHF